MKSIVTFIIILLALVTNAQELKYTQVKETISNSLKRYSKDISNKLELLDFKGFEILNFRILEITPSPEHESIFEDFGLSYTDYLVKSYAEISFKQQTDNNLTVLTETSFSKILDTYQIDYIKLTGIKLNGEYICFENKDLFIPEELKSFCNPVDNQIAKR